MISQQLLITIFLPLAGAVAMWPLATLGRGAARLVALAVTLFTLWCAGQLISNFPASGLPPGTDFAVTDSNWLASAAQIGLDIRFSVGLDGLGLWMFGLTALLFVTAVLVSWRAIQGRAPLFYGMLLVLEF